MKTEWDEQAIARAQRAAALSGKPVLEHTKTSTITSGESQE